LTLIVTAQAFADNPITDARGRALTLPDRVERIICSGPGSLRLATYLGVQDRVVAVDDIEVRQKRFDARPYALAVPAYKTRPVFGEFRGYDDPEKILGLGVQPQVIFKTYAATGHDPVELQNKTGIPVVILDYGDLSRHRDQFYTALRIMARALDVPDRAEAVIDFFNREIKSLAERTANLAHPKTCFVGGIAFKGPHGYASTEPFYPPFALVNAENIASRGLPEHSQLRHSVFSKETLLTSDPQVLFLDLSTLQMGKGQGGLFELRTDPVFQALTAVEKGEVYALLPYNWYTGNYGSILANAWYIGKVLYPEQFQDIDPAARADEIYTALLGAPVFNQMNAMFRNMAFSRVDLTQ
jgi:iron complex transport system substrate-binding protein